MVEQENKKVCNEVEKTLKEKLEVKDKLDSGSIFIEAVIQDICFEIPQKKSRLGSKVLQAGGFWG